MSQKRKLLVIFFSFLLVFSFSSKIKAQVVDEERQKRDFSGICERVNSRIDYHLTRYAEHKEDFVKRVDEAISRLKDINQKLKDKGCETAKLEADYQQLYNQLDTWTTEYNLFINLLNEAKTLTCGESQGVYKDKVHQARNQLRTVRQEGVGIVQFYHQTVRPDVEALREICFPAKD